MLTVQDLLVQDTIPLLRDISLILYKDFCTNVLFKKRFHYYFEDGTDLILECKEWGVYHMMAIHHIDYTIGKDTFFQKIDNGLQLNDFKANDAIEKRFNPYKKRIRMFSCIYRTLRYGRVFYVPNKDVPNTVNVRCDYLIYRQIDNVGMNIGLKYSNGCFVPMTNLISKESNRTEYIDTTTPKIVKRLVISDISTGAIEEDIFYSDNFILHR